jgi:hypothetical protein
VNDRQRAALERAAEFAQERSRHNWNRIVEDAEQELRGADHEAARRRGHFHIVNDED